MSRPPLLDQPHPLSKDDPKRTYGQMIVDYLQLGATVEDACAYTGVSPRAYYLWRRRGQAEIDRVEGNSRASVRNDEAMYVQFFHDTTRAQAAARVAAVGTVRSAIKGTTQNERRTETFSETRLRRLPDGSEQPYQYVREVVTVTEREVPGDWRAAIEYLKRRDPDNWSDRIHIDDWRSDALKGIKAGDILFAELVEAFGDRSLAVQLFHEAGVEIIDEPAEG